ncbi:MAG: hypothetical protein R3E10_19550 [Gemmatimonadota bacterium]
MIDLRTVRQRGPRLWAALAVLCMAPAGAGAQQPGGLGVRTSLSQNEAVPVDAGIEITFDRVLERPAERVAVFIDRTDVTGLFRRLPQAMRYERGVITLPRGRHELVVYLVETASDRWTEVLRQPFQTLGRLGFTSGKTDPSLTAAYVSRLTEEYEPEAAAPGAASENIDLQFRISSEHVRQDLRMSSQLALVGASKQEKALRFYQRGEDAPRVDLSSYLLQAANGPVQLSVGHVSAGDQRHLVNRFSSRGATLALQPSSRIGVSVAALGGSNEVGWDHLIALDDGGHRLVTGAVGVEALSTPGALRLELTGLTGSVRPQSGFNQGVVNDSEESRGVALRVTAQALSRRLRLDAGLASSTFDSPDDPTLSQGFEVVDVREETSRARYLEASLDALRDLKLSSTRSVRLTLGFRHERVDPLYRSLGAYAQADRLQNQYDVSGDVGGVTLQANYGESRNNLDDIASILTSRTERSQVNVGVPLARVLGSTTRWLPALQFRTDRTHQHADDLPTDGGFSASHAPDQVSLNQSAQADWRLGRVTLGYQWNRSQQDNRQVGRENADLTVTRNSANLRMSPHRKLNLSVELGLEASENLERDETDETTRWGASLQWQVFDRSQFSVRFSDTSTENLLLTRRRLNNQVDAQWSSVLPYLSRLQGQYFLRYTRSEMESSDATFGQDDRRTAWWVDLGLNFTFF